MKKLIFLLALALQCQGQSMGRVIYGNGVPDAATPDCTQTRVYINSLTGDMYTSVGTPCAWVLKPGSGSGLTPGSVNGQVPTWSGTAWVPGTPSSGASSIPSLNSFLINQQNCSTQICNIVLLADSFAVCTMGTCGAGPTTATNRWPEQERIADQALFGSAGTGLVPINSGMTTGFSTSSINPLSWSCTGTTDFSNSSLGPSETVSAPMNSLLHMTNGAVSGSTAEMFNSTNKLTFTDLIQGGTQIAIVGLYTNDVALAEGTANFSAYTTAIINHELGLSSAPSVLLDIPPVTNAYGIGAQIPYTTAALNLCATLNIGCVNIQDTWGITYSNTDQLWTVSHPNDKGSIAEYVAIHKALNNPGPYMPPSTGSIAPAVIDGAGNLSTPGAIAAAGNSMVVGRATPVGNGNAQWSTMTVSAPTLAEYYYESTTASADNRLWRTITQSNGNWALQTVNDVINAAVSAIDVARSGTTITSITLPTVTVTGPIMGVLTTPASSSSACTVGQFENDASFHYVCTSTNTWKRVALVAF